MASDTLFADNRHVSADVVSGGFNQVVLHVTNPSNNLINTFFDLQVVCPGKGYSNENLDEAVAEVDHKGHNHQLEVPRGALARFVLDFFDHAVALRTRSVLVHRVRRPVLGALFTPWHQRVPYPLTTSNTQAHWRLRTRIFIAVEPSPNSSRIVRSM